MSREICVALYNELRKVQNCPDVEVIMTGDVSKDPKEWREIQPGSKYAHIKTNEEKEEVKANLKDPDHPLKFVIVRDMWLTGFDAPPVSILYVDKPMKGHNLMQAIARVNRVFPNKTGGIVVDFIGIADALKEATGRYTGGGGRGKPAFNIAEALAVFRQCLDDVRAFFETDIDVINWRGLPKVEREDWIAELVNELLGARRDEFLQAQVRLEKAHQLVRHLDEVLPCADEVLLYEILKVQIRKLPGGADACFSQVESAVNRGQFVHSTANINPGILRRRYVRQCVA